MGGVGRRSDPCIGGIHTGPVRGADGGIGHAVGEQDLAGRARGGPYAVAGGERAGGLRDAQHAARVAGDGAEVERERIGGRVRGEGDGGEARVERGAVERLAIRRGRLAGQVQRAAAQDQGRTAADDIGGRCGGCRKIQLQRPGVDGRHARVGVGVGKSQGAGTGLGQATAAIDQAAERQVGRAGGHLEGAGAAGGQGEFLGAAGGGAGVAQGAGLRAGIAEDHGRRVVAEGAVGAVVVDRVDGQRAVFHAQLAGEGVGAGEGEGARARLGEATRSANNAGDSGVAGSADGEQVASVGHGTGADGEQAVIIVGPALCRAQGDWADDRRSPRARVHRDAAVDRERLTCRADRVGAGEGVERDRVGRSGARERDSAARAAVAEHGVGTGRPVAGTRAIPPRRARKPHTTAVSDARSRPVGVPREGLRMRGPACQRREHKHGEPRRQTPTSCHWPCAQKRRPPRAKKFAMVIH